LRQKFMEGGSSESLSIASVPMSSQDRLSISFYETFQTSLPKRLSLTVFGGFITSIPRYAGSNLALDLSIKTLTDGHREWLQGDQKAVVLSRESYGPALVEIQRSLAGGNSGKPIETLVAILLLGIYEVPQQIGH